ncbi:MAG: LysR family transcriptional regulator [Pseudomonadales bacterium]|nr:LysR family transcriptional regulator [Pseudomonadales bacterium]
MTLTELRYLVSLAQWRHFGRSADACHVSQPTLSIAIKRLEEELGLQIFERHRHEVLLTPAGMPIIEQAQRVLNEVDQLCNLARYQADDWTQPLRMGCIFTVGPYLLPALVERLRTEQSRLRLYVTEDYTHVLLKALREGDIDVVLVAGPIDLPETRSVALYSEPFKLLLPVQHPWTDHTVINMTSLDPSQMLMLGEGHCLRDQVLTSCPQLLTGAEGHLPNGSSLATLRHMVALGIGMTLIPGSAVNTLAGETESCLCVRSLDPEPGRQIVALSRQRFARNSALRELMSHLHALHLPGTEPC